MKNCSKCGLEKNESEFGKNVAMEDGLQSYCRDCISIYKKEQYRKKHPEFERKTADIKAYQKKYRENNREHLLELHAAWMKAHPEVQKEKSRRKYERKMKLLHGDDYVVGLPWNSVNNLVRPSTFLTPDERRKAKNAGKAVARALKTGRLVQQPCWCCGSLEVEAHHPDYDASLDVVWLCREHHTQVHTEFRKLYVDISE